MYKHFPVLVRIYTSKIQFNKKKIMEKSSTVFIIKGVSCFLFLQGVLFFDCITVGLRVKGDLFTRQAMWDSFTWLLVTQQVQPIFQLL
jgi:hypothetical protein